MKAGDVLWTQGDVEGTFAALTVAGVYESLLEHETGTTEIVEAGDLIGLHDLCLVDLNRDGRVSTVTCSEGGAIYRLGESEWFRMKRTEPELANLIYSVCVNLLQHRIMHCSNRIFETRCLPV